MPRQHSTVGRGQVGYLPPIPNIKDRLEQIQNEVQDNYTRRCLEAQAKKEKQDKQKKEGRK